MSDQIGRSCQSSSSILLNADLTIDPNAPYLTLDLANVASPIPHEAVPMASTAFFLDRRKKKLSVNCPGPAGSCAA